mmetsp:Transcript_5815/g.22974  ORF Transcript_5815/g.22974 Transcript_5815/m.22974 type:complete len:252 (+) Transcript_5815:1930-2685(+)
MILGALHIEERLEGVLNGRSHRRFLVLALSLALSLRQDGILRDLAHHVGVDLRVARVVDDVCLLVRMPMVVHVASVNAQPGAGVAEHLVAHALHLRVVGRAGEQLDALQQRPVRAHQVKQLARLARAQAADELEAARAPRMRDRDVQVHAHLIDERYHALRQDLQAVLLRQLILQRVQAQERGHVLLGNEGGARSHRILHASAQRDRDTNLLRLIRQLREHGLPLRQQRGHTLVGILHVEVLHGVPWVKLD